MRWIYAKKISLTHISLYYRFMVELWASQVMFSISFEGNVMKMTFHNIFAVVIFVAVIWLFVFSHHVQDPRNIYIPVFLACVTFVACVNIFYHIGKYNGIGKPRTPNVGQIFEVIQKITYVIEGRTCTAYFMKEWAVFTQFTPAGSTKKTVVLKAVKVPPLFYGYDDDIVPQSKYLQRTDFGWKDISEENTLVFTKDPDNDTIPT